MYGPDRDSNRRLFVTAWARHRAGQALEPLERIIVDIIAQHPEYHDLLQDEERALGADYTPEQGATNPFLHMGMHIAIAEQLAGDRPAGIVAVYQQLKSRFESVHETEHRIMECLGEALWQAQRAGRQPDENAYLECLKRMMKKRP